MQLPNFDPGEIGWDLNTERKSIQVVPDEDLEELIEFHIRREQGWFRIWRYLTEHHPCDFSAVLFDGIDKLQHLAWPFIDESSFPSQPSALDIKIRARCLEYFRELDRVLASVVERTDNDTQIFLVSDHGLGPTFDIFYVNMWLHENGLLQWNTSQRVPELDEEFAAERMKAQHGLIDWANTVAYAMRSRAVSCPSLMLSLDSPSSCGPWLVKRSIPAGTWAWRPI
jgi:predicted AlkP superfamily phosphohydrolase/phosphomutase